MIYGNISLEMLEIERFYVNQQIDNLSIHTILRMGIEPIINFISYMDISIINNVTSFNR